jgi:hypothetical protein
LPAGSAGRGERARQIRRIGAPLGLVTTAFFTNYLDTYLLLGIFPPARYLTTVLAKRELAALFGDVYRDYQR